MQHDHPPHPWDYSTIAVLSGVHLGCCFAPFFYSPSGMVVGLFLYALTSMGITIGYHRLLTHRSYKAPKWLAYLIVLCGALSVQAGPATWVAIHRQHHAHSDQEDDPHDASQGFWWSHLGWMLKVTPRRMDSNFTKRLARDILEDPFYRFLDKMFLPIALFGAYLLFLLGGWSWVFWGFFVRVAAVFQSTWLVNSAAHRYGYRSFATRDLSTNCWWVALLTFGEGWHNNHHAFPTSARHGLKWWEFDMSWLVISGLERLGLIEKVRVPSAEKQRQVSR